MRPAIPPSIANRPYFSGTSLAAFLILHLAPASTATIVLPIYFTNNMVIQRNIAAPVWGTAAANEQVTVQFGGQTKTARAAANGSWRILLDSMPASIVPRQMIISGTNTITLNNVVVGDVWLLNGQSNMEYKFMWITDNFYHDTLTNANYSLLRYTDVTFDWRWMACTPASADSFCVVGYYFGRDILLSLSQQVPIGLIDCSAGGTKIEQWMKSRNGDNYALYLRPLVGYGIRGMAWYQGEANDVNAAEYHGLLDTAIREWRAEWGQGDFPFLIVQLPNYGSQQTSPVEAAATWTLVREGQLMALAEPGTGLAVTIDMANVNPTDLHPLMKWIAGKRLALWARHMVYGQKGFAYSGPIFKSMNIRGNKAYLHFYHKGDSLVKQGATLGGFAICGSNNQYSWATAAIRGDSIEAYSSAVAAPVAVRYGWAMNPIGNLYNSAGLPASPFRTDGPQLPAGLFDENDERTTAAAIPAGGSPAWGHPVLRQSGRCSAILLTSSNEAPVLVTDATGRRVFRGRPDMNGVCRMQWHGPGVYLVRVDGRAGAAVRKAVMIESR